MARLKQYGFKWAQDGSYDRVDPGCVKDIKPSVDGFVVTYTDDSALVSTHAVVTSIEDNDDPENNWIFVHWKTLKDQRTV